MISATSRFRWLSMLLVLVIVALRSAGTRTRSRHQHMPTPGRRTAKRTRLAAANPSGRRRTRHQTSPVVGIFVVSLAAIAIVAIAVSQRDVPAVAAGTGSPAIALEQ